MITGEKINSDNQFQYNVFMKLLTLKVGQLVKSIILPPRNGTIGSWN